MRRPLFVGQRVDRVWRRPGLDAIQQVGHVRVTSSCASVKVFIRNTSFRSGERDTNVEHRRLHEISHCILGKSGGVHRGGRRPAATMCRNCNRCSGVDRDVQRVLCGSDVRPQDGLRNFLRDSIGLYVIRRWVRRSPRTQIRKRTASTGQRVGRVEPRDWPPVQAPRSLRARSRRSSRDILCFSVLRGIPR